MFHSCEIRDTCFDYFNSDLRDITYLRITPFINHQEPTIIINLEKLNFFRYIFINSKLNFPNV